MTKATTENEAAETPADPAPAQAYGVQAYAPTPEERAESRRHSALHFATSIRSPGHVEAARVLDDAKMFDAWLSAGDAA